MSLLSLKYFNGMMYVDQSMVIGWDSPSLITLWFCSSYSHLLLVFHSQVVQWLTNPPASAGDTRDVGSVPRSGRSPEVENGNPLSILAWKMLWTEEPCGLQCMRSQSQTQLSTRALRLQPSRCETAHLQGFAPWFFFYVLPFLWSDCIHTHARVHAHTHKHTPCFLAPHLCFCC